MSDFLVERPEDSSKNNAKQGNVSLFLLAVIWYGCGVIALAAIPFLWAMATEDISALSALLNNLTIDAIFIPWGCSAVLFLYAMRGVVEYKNTGAFLTVLHIACVFLMPFIWSLVNFISNEPLEIVESFTYLFIGVIVGVLTFGLIFTSFLPVVSTVIAFAIIGKQMLLLSTMRKVCIFLLFLGSWFIVLFTGFILAHA